MGKAGDEPRLHAVHAEPHGVIEEIGAGSTTLSPARASDMSAGGKGLVAARGDTDVLRRTVPPVMPAKVAGDGLPQFADAEDVGIEADARLVGEAPPPRPAASHGPARHRLAQVQKLAVPQARRCPALRLHDGWRLELG